MIITFKETMYGDIECNSETKLAYFKLQDYEAPIDEKGNFKDWWDTPFNVMYPIHYMSSSDAILTVTRPVQICRVKTVAKPVTC